ncbi:MAG: HAD family hydrolase [Terriglobia bacterium]
MQISAILTDVGGVLGTNAWDRPTRVRAAERFSIPWGEFEERHELVVNAFELGRLSLDEYLERAVFFRPREFTRQEFRDFMFVQSQPFPEAIALFQRLAGARRYLLAVMNNESTELNLHRVEKFGLRNIFSVFFSSCFLGVKKPDDAIYRAALKLTQREPGECLFIDDRPLNVERARKCGMRVIHCQDPLKLEKQMAALGVL